MAAHTSAASGVRTGGSAKSVLVTILGEFVMPQGGSVWTGTVVDALGLLGFAERNARQALARVGDDGLIEPERHGRRTQWHLTGAGRRLLEVGAERIYGFGRRSEPWDGRWLVVHCAVPETSRPKRHQLTTRLAFEGFGFLSPTVAVSPYGDLEGAAERVLADLDLAESAVVLIAETGALSPDAVILDRAWDLTSLEESYRMFLDGVAQAMPGDDGACFGALVHLVHEWRRFPFLDPEFPSELLPDEWIGHEARARFDHCRSRWAPDATNYFKHCNANHEG